jgi:hypothetical protein
MPVRSRARIATVVAGMLLVFANTSLVSAATDVKVTDQTYVRFDGGSDSATSACSTNNRQQNEPSAAVNPNDGDQMVSGANDYCTVPTFGGTWAGFYYTNDGGTELDQQPLARLSDGYHRGGPGVTAVRPGQQRG